MADFVAGESEGEENKFLVPEKNGEEKEAAEEILVEKTAGLDIASDDDIVEVSSSSVAAEKNLVQANEAKEEGNSCFRVKDYDNAISMYSRAIVLCPTDDEHNETLAVFYGNRAAAYFAVDEYECVVDDCSSALELNADYVKVLMRRSQAYEKLSKQEDALADAKKVMELDPSFPKIGSTVQRLERECEIKMNKLKDEAMGKLKDLGNSILGNFGMSLDSFKMTQDPNSGGWNIR